MGDDIIVVEPNIADRFLENLTLRADVSGVTDPYGNEMEVPIHGSSSLIKILLAG